ncbi:MAG: hypothetical protein KY453_01210 [Gemmatimonadetes bacterium]|nr:hypothetical protein [Gemmatimonadota bacterium]
MSNVYLRALRAWWWAVVLPPLLAMAVAAMLTAGVPRVYRAAATATVAPASDIENPSDVMRGLETLERRTVIATFASVAGARETRDSAADRAQLPERGRSGYRVRASVVPSTNIIRVSVEGRDPEGVSAMANAVVAVLGDRAGQLYGIFEIRPLEAAAPPRVPLHPDPVRNVAIAGVLGLFAGFLLALVLEHLRPARSRSTTPLVEQDAPPRVVAGR